MKQRILVLGGTGMAGHVCVEYLTQLERYKVYNICFRNKFNSESIICDLTNHLELTKIIHEIRPHFLINCVGALLRQSKEDPSTTIYLNSFLPHFLVKLSVLESFKLVQISTDCVFNGHLGNYLESDVPSETNLYGRSKALGEITNDPHITIRTSIIGPELKISGEGLLHWFLLQRGQVKGFSKVFWSGVTTLELAKAIRHSIEHNISGLFHLTNNTKISKRDLLILFRNILSNNGVSIVDDASKVVDKSLINSRKDISYLVPPYESMMNELKVFMISHNQYYRHYNFSLGNA